MATTYMAAVCILAGAKKRVNVLDSVAVRWRNRKGEGYMVTAEHKARVDSITRLKALFAEAEAMPQPDSISPESLAQLKAEREALRVFDRATPVVSGEHYLARCLAYDAYQKIDGLVKVYEKAKN